MCILYESMLILKGKNQRESRWINIFYLQYPLTIFPFISRKVPYPLITPLLKEAYIIYPFVKVILPNPSFRSYLKYPMLCKSYPRILSSDLLSYWNLNNQNILAEQLSIHYIMSHIHQIYYQATSQCKLDD